jgi:hypothetical protein
VCYEISSGRCRPVQAGYKGITDKYIVSSTKITVYHKINLVGGERGKSISRRSHLCEISRKYASIVSTVSGKYSAVGGFWLVEFSNGRRGMSY